MASPILPLLESFYRRLEPRGVAFVGSAKLGVTLGRDPTPLIPHLESQDGSTQLHFEGQCLSVYASYFGWGKILIAQFGFQDDFPPPSRPWFAFARLAGLIQRYLDDPSEWPEPPAAPVREPRPRPDSPQPSPLRVEAPFRLREE
jgi:hypothetical protein